MLITKRISKIEATRNDGIKSDNFQQTFEQSAMNNFYFSISNKNNYIIPSILHRFIIMPI